MRICDRYEHKKALSVLEKRISYKEISSLIELPHLKFGNYSTKYIKSKISDRFNESGWADRVKVVSGANLTISCDLQ